MWYRLPFPPLAFEISDEWWSEAGAVGFQPNADCFVHTACGPLDHLAIISLRDVAPMLREPGSYPNGHGFRKHGPNGETLGGMVGVLTAIVTGEPLPPVKACRTRAASAEGMSYKVFDGFHRFYASHALGFTHLPCVLVQDLGGESLFGDG